MRVRVRAGHWVWKPESVLKLCITGPRVQMGCALGPNPTWVLLMAKQGRKYLKKEQKGKKTVVSLSFMYNLEPHKEDNNKKKGKYLSFSLFILYNSGAVRDEILMHSFEREKMAARWSRDLSRGSATSPRHGGPIREGPARRLLRFSMASGNHHSALRPFRGPSRPRTPRQARQCIFT